MSKTPNLDELADLAKLLYEMTREPHPGLLGWRLALHQTIVALVQFSGDRTLLAAPDLLAACAAIAKMKIVCPQYVASEMALVESAIAKATGSITIQTKG